MTELIAERPLAVAFMIGLLGVAMLYGWLQSGKRPLAITGLLMLVLAPLAYGISERIVTDRERIEQLIYRTADAVEANDHDAVLALIDDEPTRRQAAMELPRYEFTLADVASIREITILEGTSPLRAEVDMNVKVVVSDRRGSLKNIRVPRRLMLTLQERPGSVDGQREPTWVVTGYQHMPIVGQPDGFTTSPIR
ncbi:MAG: hypothetical protein AAF670_05850 [Planctomycetota bacterium]